MVCSLHESPSLFKLQVDSQAGTDLLHEHDRQKHNLIRSITQLNLNTSRGNFGCESSLKIRNVSVWEGICFFLSNGLSIDYLNGGFS